MSERIQVGVNGAAGRMGQRIVALTYQDPELYVGAALEAADNPEMGRDVGEIAGIGAIGMPVTAELRGNVDVIIDFSTPDGLIEIAEICAERHIGLVAATTGLSEKQQSTVAEVAHVTPVLMAPNLSVAVNLTMKLVRDAAIALKGVGGGVDVEIIERHHRFKEDAPSGTALRFGEIVAEQMGQTEHVHGRQGRPGPRPQTEIGYHSLRTGDNVGEHLIVFGLMGETIDISVRGHTRDSYAYGALAAAKFLVNKPPALYSMSDVLGF